ncbi:MAG TPA: DNA topoisomerase IV subunit B [Clostridiales bacterium]|nr:DNA topoisomerase IV subunit B [Clostridiales bacterium]
MAEKSYNADDLKILEGLEAVRIRPGMYIGSTGVKGLHHILWEIVDNSVDEAANGFADEITVKLWKDGSASVEDNGRGMPTDINTKAGVSGVEVIFTKLHAGGKFDTENYAFSGGLHGVGASVTNALSEWVKVEVYRGTVFKMGFSSRFDSAKKKWLCGIPDAPLSDTKEKTKKHGTLVRFMPDKEVFETVEWNYDTISKRLKELAFLNKGLKINLIDERELYRETEADDDIDGDSSRTVKELLPPREAVSFKYDGGLIDFVKYLNGDRVPLYNQPLYYSTVSDIQLKGAPKGKIKIEFALCHTKDDSESLFSFVNNISTVEGGYHETGFHNGLLKSINEYAKNSGVLKAKDSPFIVDDIKEGLTAVLTVKMTGVEFEGQTKTKLGNPEVKAPVEQAVVDGLGKLLSVKGNRAIFDEMAKKAKFAADDRIKHRAERDVAKAASDNDGLNLIGKLAPCSGKNPEMNELFIVEGDSAGGTAKQARVRQYQSILPLRGKPLNVQKKSALQALQNEEIKTLVSAIGAGFNRSFEVDKSRYKKVIILSDADQDGMHIRCILLTFFFKYMRDLVNAGCVYIGMPPLYKVYKKDRVEYAYDDKELDEKIKEVGKGYQIQRYKGLGEMSADQLWDTTMNPATRNLIQVTIEDAAEAANVIEMLMGDKVDGRKEFLAQNANFNKVDGFIEKVNFKPENGAEAY